MRCTSRASAQWWQEEVGARDAATAVEAVAGANGNTNMYADMLLGAAADDAAFVPKVVGSNSAAAAGPAHSAGSSTAVFDG